MPPRRKKAPKNVAISKSNVQTVIVKVGDTKKKRAPRRRRPKPSEGDSIPMRQLPPVVYQVPAQTTGYLTQPAIMQPNYTGIPITQREPVRVVAPILEDIGSIGTSEIIDVPSKKEQLAELITPVAKQPSQSKTDIIFPRAEERSSLSLIQRAEEKASLSLLFPTVQEKSFYEMPVGSIEPPDQFASSIPLESEPEPKKRRVRVRDNRSDYKSVATLRNEYEALGKGKVDLNLTRKQIIAEIKKLQMA